MRWQGWMIAGGIVLIVGALYLVGRWLSTYAKRTIRSRIQAVEQIVKEERVPESWLRPYAVRVRQLEEAGAHDAQIVRVQELAQKQCLANIQELIRYGERVNFSSSERRQQEILASLRAHASRWQDAEAGRWFAEARAHLESEGRSA